MSVFDKTVFDKTKITLFKRICLLFCKRQIITDENFYLVCKKLNGSLYILNEGTRKGVGYV